MAMLLLLPNGLPFGGSSMLSLVSPVAMSRGIGGQADD